MLAEISFWDFILQLTERNPLVLALLTLVLLALGFLACVYLGIRIVEYVRERNRKREEHRREVQQATAELERIRVAAENEQSRAGSSALTSMASAFGVQLDQNKQLLEVNSRQLAMMEEQNRGIQTRNTLQAQQMELLAAFSRNSDASDRALSDALKAQGDALGQASQTLTGVVNQVNALPEEIKKQIGPDIEKVMTRLNEMTLQIDEVNKQVKSVLQGTEQLNTAFTQARAEILRALSDALASPSTERAAQRPDPLVTPSAPVTETATNA